VSEDLKKRKPVLKGEDVDDPDPSDGSFENGAIEVKAEKPQRGAPSKRHTLGGSRKAHPPDKKHSRASEVHERPADGRG